MKDNSDLEKNKVSAEEFLSIPKNLRDLINNNIMDKNTDNLINDFVIREENNSYCLAEMIKYLYLFQKNEQIDKHLNALTNSLIKYNGEIGILHKVISIYVDLNKFDENIANISLSLILRNINNDLLIKSYEYKEEFRLMIKHIMVYVKRYYIKISEEITDKILSLDWGNDFQIKNIFLNEIEYHQKKTSLTSKPRIAEITLTNKCNLECKMCGNVIKEKWELNQKGINNIIKLLPYLESVNWYGGEVGLFEDFQKLTNVAYLNNVDQNIITNGLVWTEPMLQYVLRGKVSITVSVDGFDDDSYAYTRGVNRLSEVKNFLRKVNACRNEKTKLMMNTIIMRHNINQIEAIEDFATEYNIDTVYILPLMGWRQDFFVKENIFFEEDGVSLKKLNKEIENIYEIITKVSLKLKKKGIELVNSLPVIKCVEMPNQNDKVIEQNIIKETKKLDVCYAPWKHISVYDDGAIAFSCTCNNKKIMFGDINKDDIFDAWNCDKVQQIRKNIINSALDGHVLKECSEIGCFGAYY